MLAFAPDVGSKKSPKKISFFQKDLINPEREELSSV
jgi:hypothetical protein